jgi:hypothetical protein
MIKETKTKKEKFLLFQKSYWQLKTKRKKEEKELKNCLVDFELTGKKIGI